MEGFGLAMIMIEMILECPNTTSTSSSVLFFDCGATEIKF